MMLHLVSSSPLTQEIVGRMASGDDVVLQQAAIWAAMVGHADNAKLAELTDKGCRAYVLRELLEVNGISEPQVLEGVGIIDYSGFVELTVRNPVIHTWC